jgi:hypothetical protein
MKTAQIQRQLSLIPLRVWKARRIPLVFKSWIWGQLLTKTLIDALETGGQQRSDHH